MTVENEARIDWKARGALLACVVGAVCAAVGVFLYAMHWLDAHHAPRWQVMGATVLYAAAIMGIVVLARARARRFTDIRPSIAMKRYSRRIMAVAAIYTLAVLVAVFIFVQFRPTGPSAYLIALIPAPPAAGFLITIGRYLREETDEFWRNIQVEANLMAGGGAMMLASAWGFLEIFRLAPTMPAFLIIPVYALLYGPCVMIVHRRYQ